MSEKEVSSVNPPRKRKIEFDCFMCGPVPGLSLKNNKIVCSFCGCGIARG